ncbi:hypothetical protein Sgou_25690 [Streptomyces gougerotii]|uniref:Uncharacterized protein n=2 Tax=Streptomyces diastaticus group TaxID=2849069 RepID=A0A8H9LM97_9ACTN|nr:hypothetical protein Srut_10040 [Streptomyces rutgersensis]GFH70088.1 hypothetical protein Sdia_08560 [Streptomyces diastaticus subsp. diastaticus]GFH77899.1 hypothetical protein Sgou_25690 [Streptomyces gougerotii]GGU14994.1 hypothetical protein GCM10015534_17020 [Streptomyces diastaticus subsp. diastaticus]GGU81544.1 hypothetical protein GCM10010227_39720 [Streptomyces gougerotii]
MVSTGEEPLSSLVRCEFNPLCDGDPPTGVSLVSPRAGSVDRPDRYLTNHRAPARRPRRGPTAGLPRA